MPISYKRKRQILLEKKQRLVPALQKLISLRNISDALRLPANAQETLASALNQGVKKQRLALEFLLREPGANVEQLRKVLDVGDAADALSTDDAVVGENNQGLVDEDEPRQEDAIIALTDLLLEYGLYDNRLIAEIVASSDYMAGIRNLILAIARVREPGGAETETVTLALCAIIVRLITEINELLRENKAHKSSVMQSKPLGWAHIFEESP